MIDIDDETDYSILGVRAYGKGVFVKPKVYGKNLKMKKYKIARENQLMWCKVDTKNGAFGVVKKEHNGCLASINMALADINTKAANPVFVELLFRNPFFYNYINSRSTGTTNRKYLTPSQVCTEVEIPNLTKEGQDLFVAKYEKFKSSKIHSNIVKDQEYVQNLRQAILQDAVFGKLNTQDPNDEPASELLKKIKAHQCKLIKQKGFAKHEKLIPASKLELSNSFPRNWVLVKLNEITDVVRGGSPRPAGSKEFYEGKIPFLKVADLTSDEQMYLKSYTTTIKPSGLRKTRFVKANTLMLTNSGATLGVPKICTFDTTFNDGIAAFLNVPDFVDIRYLYLFLKSKTKWFLEFASQGQGQPNLNTNLIGGTLIPIPSLNEQKRIFEKVDQLMKLCDEIEEKIEDNQKNSKFLMEAVLKEAFAT
jgi:type I restriction enzyme, S subunit